MPAPGSCSRRGCSASIWPIMSRADDWRSAPGNQGNDDVIETCPPLISTRGRAPQASFADVLLAGLAPDGGLYLPQAWPQFSAAQISGFANRPYNDVAC